MFKSKRDVKIFFVWFYLVVLMFLFVIHLILMLFSKSPLLIGMIFFELSSLIAWSYALDENEQDEQIDQAYDKQIESRLEAVSRAQNSSVVLPER